MKKSLKKELPQDKTLIVLLAIILLMILVFGVILVQSLQSNVATIDSDVFKNKSEGIIEEKIIDGIKMSHTSLTVKNGASKLVTSVYNTTNEDYYLKEYSIIVRDKIGRVITIIPGYVGDVIKPRETRKINSSVDIDLSDAKSIDYEVNK